MKFALNDKSKEFYWFPGDDFSNFIYFFHKLDLSVFVDLEKFKLWYHKIKLWSPKTSSFMQGLSWSLL